MAQTIYDSLQGFNPEIVTVGTLLEPYDFEGAGSTNDDDLFQCGKCKKQFFSLGAFIVHKETHQLSKLQGVNAFPTTNNSLVESLAADTSSEDMQLQPIILNESDILSFSIGQSAGLCTTDQALASFEENEALLMPEAVDSLKDSSLTSSFELRSTQIILTTQITNEEPMEHLMLSSNPERIGSLDQPISILPDKSYSSPMLIIPEGTEDQSQSEKAAEQSPKWSKFKCPYCMKEFSKNFDFQQHLRVHTGEKPFQCVVCGRSFAQKSNVKKHMATHKIWPQRKKTLPENPIKKDDDTVMVDGSYACQYCSASFKSYPELKSHKKTHIHSKVFKCVQLNCEAVFESLDQFLEHSEMHREDQSTQYRCCHCKLRFPNLDDLTNHQFLNPPCLKKQKSPASCSMCKARFTSQEGLEKHLSEDSHSYPCPECDKLFVSEGKLRRHLLMYGDSHHHQCMICGKKLKTAQGLKAHVEVHSGEKPFVCTQCPAAFGRQDRLIRHTFIHDKAHRFKCPFNKHLGCKKEFYRKDKLKQHLVTHVANKSLRCKRCSRVFKRGSQLKRHEAACLSEDKPCKDCGHVTSSLENYKKNTSKTKDQKVQIQRKRKPVAEKKNDVPTIEVVVFRAPNGDVQVRTNKNDSKENTVTPDTKQPVDGPV